MDKEFAQVLYRSIMMLARYLEKRYGFGHNDPPPQYEVELKHAQENVIIK